MATAMDVKRSISQLVPYSDGVLIDPWPIYAELQDAGPAVWLSKYEMFALTRYETVRKALDDPSSSGAATCIKQDWAPGKAQSCAQSGP